MNLFYLIRQRLVAATRPRLDGSFQAGLLLVLLLPGGFSAQAQNNWTGNTSRDWNTAGNWSGGIPTASSDVVIPSGPANQPIISTTATANSVNVQTAASLSISSAGSLSINGFATLGGFASAFYNQGAVTNGGTVILGNTAPVGLMGLHTIGTFTNTGTLRVDRATNQGINNRGTGTFANTGIVTIGASVSIGTQGIWNQATFTHSGGTVTIDRITGDGLLNSGNFINSATLTIGASVSVSGAGISNGSSASFTNGAGGYVQIDRTGSHAIATSGLFNNSAVISIGSSALIGGQGISNSGTVNNNPDATITINRTGTGVGGDGLYNSGTFVNSSSLTIGDVDFVGQDDIYNAGTFRNTATGQIRADRATGNGIWNLGSSTFQNDGKIVIGSLANMGVGMLCDGLSFANTAGAEIHINRVSRGMTNTKIFTNAGQIRMGNNAPLGERGFLNGNSTGTVPAVFNNLPGGLLQIGQTAAGQDGITNDAGTTFTNAGTVSIGTSGSIGGNAITNGGTFTNLVCAVIRAFAPVYNENGTFTNNGFLTVNTLRKPTKTIVRVNSPAGIARTYLFSGAGYGPPVSTVNLTADAVLVNDGTANPIQEGCNPPTNAAQLAGKIALVDRGTCASNEKVYAAQQAGAIAVIMFGNAPGPPPGMGGGQYASQITIPALSMTQADGAAIKAALAGGSVNITITQEEVTSTTLVTNNGVIAYPPGNPIPNVTNNALVISSLRAACAGAAITPALQLGGSSGFSAGTTWYADAGLTQSAGTYTAATNTFTPGNLSVGTQTLYLVVTDNGNACSQTVPVSVTINALSISAITPAALVICEEQALSLTATVSGSTAYSLTVSLFNGPTLVISQTVAANTNIASISIPQTGTLTSATLVAVATTSAGCSTTFVGPVITVTPIAFAGPPTLNSTTYSPGQTAIVSYSAGSCSFKNNGLYTVDLLSAATSYTQARSLLAVAANATSLSVVIPANLPPGTYKLQVVYGDPVYSPVSVTFVVNSLTLTITASTTLICIGQPVSLTASGCGTGASYQWSTGQTGPVIIYTPRSTSLVSVTCVTGPVPMRVAAPGEASSGTVDDADPVRSPGSSAAVEGDKPQGVFFRPARDPRGSRQ